MSTDTRSLIDEILCAAFAAGLLLVLLVPAARGSAAIGWLPMWLVGMPAVAWWAARGFPLPRRVRMAASPVRPAHARRPQPQARRSPRPRPVASARRAA